MRCLKPPDGAPDGPGAHLSVTAWTAKSSGSWLSGGTAPTGCATSRSTRACGSRWPGGRVPGGRAGTARIVEADDPGQRQRLIGQVNLARRLCVCASRAMDTSPLTVRVDLDAG